MRSQVRSRWWKLAVVLLPLLLAGADYRQALAPRDWSFPRDHGRHDGYRIEWWYFTGNLFDDAGRRFGYQLTFFRSQLSPDAPERSSDFATNQLYFAHAALADVQAGQFAYHDTLSRGLPGLASASDRTLDVQLKDWSAVLQGKAVHLVAPTSDFTLDLRCTLEPPVLQGPGGLSRKGPNPGQASYYYSMPTMQTTGTIVRGGRTYHVHGLSWMDHEFSSNLLADNQTGWDWVSLQLLDGRALMLYRLRNKDGSTTRFGSLAGTDGKVEFLQPERIQMMPSDPVKAPSGAAYPQRWAIRVPGVPAFTLRTVLPDAELQTGESTKVTYYEGPADAIAADGKKIGMGYLEMTGYAGAEKR